MDSAANIHLLALLCTLLVEGIGMALWARLAYPQPFRALLCALAVNLVVHTLFWYSQPLFAFLWPTGLYIAELLVVLLEATLYAHLLRLSTRTSLLLSTALNLASLLAGLWLWQILL